MIEQRRLTTTILGEGNGFVSHCPEFDVARQGGTVEEARANLAEALTLLLEVAPPTEIEERMHSDVFVSQVEVPVGSA